MVNSKKSGSYHKNRDLPYFLKKKEERGEIISWIGTTVVNWEKKGLLVDKLEELKQISTNSDMLQILEWMIDLVTEKTRPEDFVRAFRIIYIWKQINYDSYYLLDELISLLELWKYQKEIIESYKLVFADLNITPTISRVSREVSRITDDDVPRTWTYG